jgi:hypothetical protein
MTKKAATGRQKSASGVPRAGSGRPANVNKPTSSTSLPRGNTTGRIDLKKEREV